VLRCMVKLTHQGQHRTGGKDRVLAAAAVVEDQQRQTEMSSPTGSTIHNIQVLEQEMIQGLEQCVHVLEFQYIWSNISRSWTNTPGYWSNRSRSWSNMLRQDLEVSLKDLDVVNLGPGSGRSISSNPSRSNNLRSAVVYPGPGATGIAGATGQSCGATYPGPGAAHPGPGAVSADGRWSRPASVGGS